MLSHITEIKLTWETLKILLHRWVAYHSSIVCVVPEAPVQDLVQSFVIAAVVTSGERSRWTGNRRGVEEVAGECGNYKTRPVTGGVNRRPVS